MYFNWDQFVEWEAYLYEQNNKTGFQPVSKPVEQEAVEQEVDF